MTFDVALIKSERRRSRPEGSEKEAKKSAKSQAKSRIFLVEIVKSGLKPGDELTGGGGMKVLDVKYMRDCDGARS